MLDSSHVSQPDAPIHGDNYVQRLSTNRVDDQGTPMTPQAETENELRPQPQLAQFEEETAIAEHHNAYLFKFLRRERPLPSKGVLRAMVATLYLVMFLAGWNDASAGSLIPSLTSFYHINYLVMSLIWMANFIGFLTSGITNVIISDRFGFGIAAPFGASMQGLAYILICWGCPYPLFVIAYVFNGFGLGLQDAQVNSLITRLPNSNTTMFLMHAMYGFGATVSPFIAIAFVKRVPDRVYLYFTASLGLALFTAGSLVLVFRGRTEDQVAGKRVTNTASHESSTSSAIPVPRSDTHSLEPNSTEVTEEKVDEAPQPQSPPMQSNGSGHKMKRIMRTPVVHLMAIYMFIYVGVEVTIGGWTTTFLENERGGSNNVIYVSSGFFGGLTLGRAILIPVTKRLGNHLSISVYTIIVIALLIAIWLTHSIVGNAICFSIIGLCMGPMYPIVMNVVVEILPGELQGGTIGWLASLGQAGSAIMPFIVGSISDKYGVWVLMPICISFMSLSIITWLLVVVIIRKGAS